VFSIPLVHVARYRLSQFRARLWRVTELERADERFNIDRDDLRVRGRNALGAEVCCEAGHDSPQQIFPGVHRSVDCTLRSALALDIFR
jgi:hypothetical protein